VGLASIYLTVSFVGGALVALLAGALAVHLARRGPGRRRA
jgi:hypothetical protein